MKKIAYVRASNIYDDSRATKEIIGFVKAGYEVIVFGWNRNGDSISKCNDTFALYLEKIKFHFFNKVISDNSKNSVTKIFMWTKWIIKTMRIDKYDFVHACDLDGGLGAYLYARKRKIKFIYDIYDYYIDSHSMNKPIKWIIEKLEIKLINYADLTIICTEERIEQLSKSTPRRLVVVHNSPDIGESNQHDVSFDYAYCGTLSDSRLIQEILNEYENNDKYKMVFAGAGKYAKSLINLSYVYPNLVYVGAVSYSEVLSIESKSRVISAIYDPSLRNHRLSAPNKFYEAMALGKPVIVCKNTGIDKIVENNEIGLVIDYNAKEFYRALNELLQNPNLCNEMGEKARQIYENKYKWSIMMEKLIDEYSSL